MYWLRLIYTRLYGLLRKNRIEQEMEEEMRFHLRMRTRENIERGMRADEAEREARRRFGNVGHIKDLGRDLKGGGFIETLLQDLRYGARMLLKTPGFTTVAVMTLALGIGANTAIFSVVNAVLLRPLSFPESERLVWLSERSPKYPTSSISYPNFIDWRTQQRVFEYMGVFNSDSYNLTGRGEPLQLTGANISADALAALQVQAAVGRLFNNQEDVPGAPPLVVLSHELWRNRFGGDPGMINQSITLSGRPYTVIGVMPSGFM